MPEESKAKQQEDKLQQHESQNKEQQEPKKPNKDQPSLEDQISEKQSELNDLKNKADREAADLDRKHAAEMRQKFGYKLNTDLKYGGKLLKADSYNRLSELKKAKIQQLLDRGDIS